MQIEDAFRYLLCGTGTCKVIRVGDFWHVHTNGRLFVESETDLLTGFRKFACVTESGTVEVSFKVRSYYG